MQQSQQLLRVRAVVGKLRACGHFLYHRTGGCTGRRRILMLLSQYPGILQKDMQALLRIQSGSLSEVVIKLEGEGLLQKVKSEADGRQWALRLTPEGEQEALRLQEAYDRQICKMMACFEEAQLDALYQQLDTMLVHWNAVELTSEDGQEEKQ